MAAAEKSNRRRRRLPEKTLSLLPLQKKSLQPAHQAFLEAKGSKTKFCSPPSLLLLLH